MSDTIAAVATAQSSAGIGIIRISGEDAIKIADKVFVPVGKKRLCQMRGYTAALGHVEYGGETVDECIALVFRAPKSYTGEDVVELSCHGGLFVLKRVLRAVLSVGAQPAKAGEFTKRAYLNGRIDLTQAEAVMDIIGAQGEQGARAALTALDGALSRKTTALCDSLLSVSASLCAWVDYPDEEIEELETGKIQSTLTEVKTGLESLLSSFEGGSAVTKGVQTAIIGKPNVGKSALMNLLSGCGRSIVTDIPGTTRDVVEQTVNLGAITLHLSDTAGIRPADDEVEKIGVDLARKCVRQAQLIFAVFDGSMPLDSQDEEILSLCKGRKAIAIINKSDLKNKADTEKIRARIPECVSLCAISGEGSDALSSAAEKIVCAEGLDTAQAMLTNERQYNDAQTALKAVDEAIDCLESGMTLDAVNVLIDSAIDSLMSLTGKKATDAVVEEIFSRFCVGK